MKVADQYQVSLKVLLKNKNNEILALKALEYGSYRGFYDLPGGRIDVDEFTIPFSKIIAREILEEIGQIKYDLKEKPVAVGRHLVGASYSRTGKEHRILHVFFEADYLGGDVKISNEHVDFAWIDLRKIELEKYFASGMLEGIKMYLGK